MNDSNKAVNGWTLKISKKDIKNISASWCVDIKEDGDYYVITPLFWNSNLQPKGFAEFGFQGTGSAPTTINYTLN